MWSGLSFLAATEAGETLRRNLRVAAVTGVGVLIGFISLVFGLMALHEWLLQRTSSIEASLIIGGVLLLVSLVFLIAAGFIRRSRKKPSALASSAIVAAPIALRLISSRLDFKAVGIASVLALGALVGRQLGRMRL